MKPGVSFDGEKRIAGRPAVCSSNQLVTACRFDKKEFGKVKFAMRAKYTLDCDINMSFNEKGEKQYGMFCQAVDVDGTTMILDQHSMDDRYGIIMLASKNAWQKVSTEPIEARIRTEGE
jgi:hypothetical protein